MTAGRPARRYQDFVLELRDHDLGAGTYQVAVLPSPAVGESGAVTVELRRDELAGALDALDRKRIYPDELVVLGEGLADRLLPAGEIRSLFVQALRAAGRDGGVRIRLLVRSPELAQLPWEYAYVQLQPGEKGLAHFLVLNPQVSLVRHEALPEPHAPLAAPPGGPVRFVVATASPAGAGPLNLSRERAVIDGALGAFRRTRAEVEWEPVIEHATAAELRRRLQAGAEVFHFAGHGGVDAAAVDPSTGRVTGRGYLLLEDDPAGGSGAAFGDDDLAALLKQAGTRLAVLGACGSARRDGVSAWNGVAPALVRQGVAAVVAMQYDVIDDFALAFMELFYEALAAGLSVDEATAAGRLAMKAAAGPRDFEWGVPVLSMRSPDGVLFPETPATKATATGFRAQIDQIVKTIAAGGEVVGLRSEGGTIVADVTVRQEVDRVEGSVTGAVLGRGDERPGAATPPVRAPRATPAPGDEPPAESGPRQRPRKSPRWKGARRPPPTAPPAESAPPAGDELPVESAPPAGDEPPEERTPAEPTPAESPRWLQADVSAGGAPVERAFVAGVEHAVDISIGRKARIRASAMFAPTRSGQQELVVRFVAGATVQQEPLWLPDDPAAESTVAGFTLPVAPGQASVAALVAVYRGRTILQAATLRGTVVADLAAEGAHPGAIELVVEQVLDPAQLAPSLTEASILTTGSTALAVGRTSTLAVDVDVLHDESWRIIESIQASIDLLAHGATDELERLLRNLAMHGRRLNASIADRLADELRAAQRLQIVSADPASFLPLELVYDGPQPTGASALCPTYRTALEAGHCLGCAGAGPEADEENPRICPLRFWGLSKVIERHAGLSEGPIQGTFAVRSERVDDRQRLRALTDAVVGASEKVTASLPAVTAAAQAAFGQAVQVTTWLEWKREVRARGPAVLLALPHHASDDTVDPPISCLELGTTLLPAGGVEVSHVTSGNQVPGPIVVLLGCNTQQDDTPLDNFAGEFRRRGASVVVGTLGEVIVDQASASAQALVAELATAVGTGNRTLGDALLRVRRKLLARDLALGLLVVGHGDADWLLPGGD